MSIFAKIGALVASLLLLISGHWGGQGAATSSSQLSLSPLVSYYNGWDHLSATRPPSNTYHAQQTLGYISQSPARGLDQLKNCLYLGSDHFTSFSENCEGQTFLETIGYVSRIATDIYTKPIYRCLRSNGSMIDHYLSSSSTCENNGSAENDGKPQFYVAKTNVLSTVPSCTLDLSSSTLTRGATTTLSWTAQHATFGSINARVGTTTPVLDGSVVITAATTTTFVYSIHDDKGQRANCRTLLTVVLPAAQFSIGDTVHASDRIAVRSSAGGTRVAVKPKDAAGVVTAQPQPAFNYIWWQVKWADGTTGWSAQQFLTLDHSVTDITPPLVSIQTPTEGTTVSGTLNIAANAWDNSGVAGVQFIVDSKNVGAETTASPFATALSLHGVSSGAHVITAIARDRAGNTTTSAPVMVQVASAPTTGTISLQAAQDTSYAGPGFWMYVFSFPLPQGTTYYTGLSGNVSLTSNSSLFSQALVSIHSAANCPPAGYSQYTDYTAFNLKYPNAGLHNFILKLAGPGEATIPTEFTLDAPVKMSGCLMVILDGATGNSASLLTMKSNIVLHYSTTAPAVLGSFMALGDEFCFNMNWGCQLHTTSGNQFAKFIPVTKSLELLSLSGDISDGALTEQSALRGGGSNPWSTDNDYYIYRKCSTAGGVYGPGNYYGNIPPTAVHLYGVTQNGLGRQSLQQAVNKSFTGITLNPGDCLVHLVKMTGGSVAVDAESQVRALVRPISTN